MDTYCASCRHRFTLARSALDDELCDPCCDRLLNESGEDGSRCVLCCQPTTETEFVCPGCWNAHELFPTGPHADDWISVSMHDDLDWRLRVRKTTAKLSLWHSTPGVAELEALQWASANSSVTAVLVACCPLDSEQLRSHSSFGRSVGLWLYRDQWWTSPEGATQEAMTSSALAHGGWTVVQARKQMKRAQARQARAMEDLEIAEAATIEAGRERIAQLSRARNIVAGTGSSRRGIPREMRYAVYERDGGACLACGSQFELQYDHIIPVALGGATTPENLQLLCGDCNRRKGASLG
jgi:5-methylcytosine-specific restriction endonuclease McrA